MSEKKNKQIKKEDRHHALFWGSSYDRGLDNLLYIWPDIKVMYPDAQLYIAYGWDLFDALRGGNPERLEWKKNVENLMAQPGITHLGRIGKKELQEVREKCGIWAYPTYFPEINCITALECQESGVVPVTMNDFALNETVGSGVLIDGKIEDPTVLEQFKKKLIDLMGNYDQWKSEQQKGIKFASKYKWKNISAKWINLFSEPVKTPKVSVITITIRSGFWNIMAKNLSKQTYNNFEWIIVDDYPNDRSQTAKFYADKYGLNIKYIRGLKNSKDYLRKYGLVAGNNLGWKNATGELLVYLQDFIVIPTVGIEMLVDVYRHNPNALIAPCDEYYFAKEPDRTNLEDWWNGNTNIIDRFSWRNTRVRFEGLRPTQNPFDFEMNYAAIPKAIIDRLNGWWSFMDDGLGYDNTEIAFRALSLGYRILIDDRNIATCINLWPIIGGTSENILSRERQLNPPRYTWFVNQMKAGNLPVVRDEELDEKIFLPFEVPSTISDEECSDWINKHTKEILSSWEDVK